MKRAMMMVVAALCVLCTASASHAEFRLGGGIHYVKTIGDIKDTPGFDSNAFNIVASAQMTVPLFKLEGDVEWINDYGGSGNSLVLPQAFVLIGGLLYGGVGIGTGYIDGRWFDDPFYALRAGVDLPLGPVHLDVNANYRFVNTKAFEDLGSKDLDSITLGAIVRFRVF